MTPKEKVMLSEKEIVEAVKELPAEEKKSLSEKLAEEFYLDVKNKGVLDAIQEKAVSRKLLVFIVATALMWYGLDPETWSTIAIIYIGSQSAVDIAKVLKGI